MTRLENSGTTKQEMMHWTLPELQNRHRQVVGDYELEGSGKEIRSTIKEGRLLSNYVLDKEKEELQHMHNLEIGNIIQNLANLFHDVQQLSKKTIVIHAKCPTNFERLGLTLQFVVVEDVDTLNAVFIVEDSLFAGSDLRIGMSIHTINTRTFSSLEEYSD